MSWFKRSAVVTALMAVTVLASCGFVPLAGVVTRDGGDGPPVEVSALSMSGATSDFEYDVRRYLSQRVAVRESATERLDLVISVDNTSLNIRQNDTVTRQNISATVRYTITDSNNEVVARGEFVSATAINATTDFFATRASEREANRLLAIDIGQKVFSLLLSRQALLSNG